MKRMQLEAELQECRQENERDAHAGNDVVLLAANDFIIF